MESDGFVAVAVDIEMKEAFDPYLFCNSIVMCFLPAVHSSQIPIQRQLHDLPSAFECTVLLLMHQSLVPPSLRHYKSTHASLTLAPNSSFSPGVPKRSSHRIALQELNSES